MLIDRSTVVLLNVSVVHNMIYFIHVIIQQLNLLELIIWEIFSFAKPLTQPTKILTPWQTK